MIEEAEGVGMELQKERFQKKHIVFVFFAYLTYFAYATFYNGFGTAAPVMMDFYQITPAQFGLVFTTQAIGATGIMIYFALYGERYNKINMFALGMLMLSACAIGVGFAPSSFAVLIILVVVAGIGYSASDVMLNGMIPELYPDKRKTLIPLLHAFFGTGAMMTPIIITAMVNPYVPSTFGRPYLFFGTLGVCSIISFFIVSRRIIPETPYADMATVRKRVSSSPAEIFKTKNAWMIIAASGLFFSYLLGMTSWLPSHFREIGLDFNMAGAITTAYFAGSLIMRFCSPLILKIISVRNAYIIFSLIAAAAVAVGLFMTSPIAIMPLIAIGGFMQGSCVALLVLMSTEAFPLRAASASALVFIPANIASMGTALWIGALAEKTGFRVPLLIICACLALSTLLVFKIKGSMHETSS